MGFRVSGSGFRVSGLGFSVGPGRPSFFRATTEHKQRNFEGEVPDGYELTHGLRLRTNLHAGGTLTSSWAILDSWFSWVWEGLLHFDWQPGFEQAQDLKESSLHLRLIPFPKPDRA